MTLEYVSVTLVFEQKHFRHSKEIPGDPKVELHYYVVFAEEELLLKYTFTEVQKDLIKKYLISITLVKQP